ncbi:MAG TPA: DUF2071 domain-containing protein [Chthonomonas sp.]|uniref:YqjF family protein n=1 Tax=Chthonomonas sp. TaxID=2282153 RepID=UPI002B4B3E8E|nr:DUF2071 domain-containing protein [Chthonomonas sp.]HLI48335.1 DUF2071 domain-containing protein [Chthonomonas sp.]
MSGVVPNCRYTGQQDVELSRMRVVMQQKWRQLLFLHWAVPEASLRPYVPPALQIDTYHGQAYVGLIAFTMREVHPWWAPPLPGLSYFHETNVRTYVHLEGKDPGVWFFSLDASSPIAVAIARTLWKLPYFWAQMRVERTTAREVHYLSRRVRQPNAYSALHCRLLGMPTAHAVPGTLEHFLLERYVLYALQDRQLYRGRIRHQPYAFQPAEILQLEEGLLSAVGLERPDVCPHVHYVEGVDVDILPLQKVG